MSFWGEEWSIFGRMTEAREELLEAAEVVCSVSIVVLWAIQALVLRSQPLGTTQGVANDTD